MLVMTFCVIIQALRVPRVQFETKKIRIHAGKNSIISIKCNMLIITTITIACILTICNFSCFPFCF